MTTEPVVHMVARCPDCGHKLLWKTGHGDELEDRIRSLEAERLRPQPPDPPRLRHGE